jgi:hypothetical protein
VTNDRTRQSEYPYKMVTLSRHMVKQSGCIEQLNIQDRDICDK